ncbi:hypothetical protein A3H38_01045 [candidate division WOR-1 bacterium RIFCSPLOWO2_02_FULL_46_20]|uniref:Large ribosomal subunit protein bL25 n=2 Tax=Saganbacteria TaxID=1703751 RepID=A0A1F4RDK3_UNCSA|nr:MAG: hypothetical protein A3J44_01370 [candidate division WOR-1 bacterium RIFCSPHIGHO2_02_FULL_45_12]OGC06274.1 MAG: hypothetical protein A3H38_01045 [candidate division WOR-1 bacterium RIFCSPLOWO2_02_FULL_46_20]OGC08619.1 MAG: hypothetical protein A3F86_01110 [candidate division WOR-1 bacterium RIFCSPLOWO2_12_FULL_45_9]
MIVVKTELVAVEREESGKNNKKIRAQKRVPAVVYGRRFKATSIIIETREFVKNVLDSDAGLNLIFNLKMSYEGKSQVVPVKTQSIQRNPLNDEIIHLDFMNVIMDEAIKTKVPIELIGLAIGVKESEGVLVHGLREIEVKCLPGDIPDKIEVDVSGLEINQSVHVSDLKIAKKVEILAEPTEMVATVSPPTKEEVAAAPLTPEEVAAAAAAATGAAAPEGEAAEAGKARPAVEGKEGKAPADKAVKDKKPSPESKK